ncbi:MAG TPA: energy transducer TonB [Longimicrobium sp.]|nr:energy transducer TonB [Longimicrobium sp.]
MRRLLLAGLAALAGCAPAMHSGTAAPTGHYRWTHLNGQARPAEFPAGSGARLEDGSIELQPGARFSLRFTTRPPGGAAARESGEDGDFCIGGDTLYFTPDGRDSRPPVVFRFAREGRVLRLWDSQGNEWRYTLDETRPVAGRAPAGGLGCRPRAPRPREQPDCATADGGCGAAAAGAPVLTPESGGSLRAAMRSLYPGLAYDAGLGAQAEVRFRVLADGRVDGESVRVVDITSTQFTMPSRQLVRGLRFVPRVVDGQPVPFLAHASLRWDPRGSTATFRHATEP